MSKLVASLALLSHLLSGWLGVLVPTPVPAASAPVTPEVPAVVTAPVHGPETEAIPSPSAGSAVLVATVLSEAARGRLGGPTAALAPSAGEIPVSWARLARDVSPPKPSRLLGHRARARGS